MKQYITAGSVELVHSGDHFFEVTKKIIGSAKEVMHLQTYILEEDHTGKDIVAALIAAASRGVKIWMLVDGYGSKELSKSFVKKLTDAGIQFRFFSPLFSSESGSAMRRLHHKILVADNNQMLVGGINIGDKYHGTAKEKAWLDFAVWVKGDCSASIQTLCKMLYDKKNFKWEKEAIARPGKQTGPMIRFRRNDWIRGKNEVYRTYKALFTKSKKSITVVGCYFLPGFLFLRYIKNATKRGVKVKIIVGAISDIPFFHHAERYLYDYLLRYNVEIYEWTESVLHGKAAIADDEWATVGSYNLNNLSKYKCIELNIDVKDKEFVKTFSADLDKIMVEKCIHITEQTYKKQINIFKRMGNAIAYYYYRFFMFMISSKDH